MILIATLRGKSLFFRCFGWLFLLFTFTLSILCQAASLFFYSPENFVILQSPKFSIFSLSWLNKRNIFPIQFSFLSNHLKWYFTALLHVFLFLNSIYFLSMSFWLPSFPNHLQKRKIFYIHLRVYTSMCITFYPSLLDHPSFPYVFFFFNKFL